MAGHNTLDECKTMQAKCLDNLRRKSDWAAKLARREALEKMVKDADAATQQPGAPTSLPFQPLAPIQPTQPTVVQPTLPTCLP